MGTLHGLQLVLILFCVNTFLMFLEHSYTHIHYWGSKKKTYKNEYWQYLANLAQVRLRMTSAGVRNASLLVQGIYKDNKMSLFNLKQQVESPLADLSAHTKRDRCCWSVCVCVCVCVRACVCVWEERLLFWVGGKQSWIVPARIGTGFFTHRCMSKQLEARTSPPP